MAKPRNDPYKLALRWLAGRELTESQVRHRLQTRQVLRPVIDAVVHKLKEAAALDDRRAALACARADALVKRHGPHRVLRRLESLGIDRDLARHTVREVFHSVDGRELMERALAGRMARRRRTISDPAEYRRLFGFLLRQGFDASAVASLLRSQQEKQKTEDRSRNSD